MPSPPLPPTLPTTTPRPLLLHAMMLLPAALLLVRAGGAIGFEAAAPARALLHHAPRQPPSPSTARRRRDSCHGPSPAFAALRSPPHAASSPLYRSAKGAGGAALAAALPRPSSASDDGGGSIGLEGPVGAVDAKAKGEEAEAAAAAAAAATAEMTRPQSCPHDDGTTLNTEDGGGGGEGISSSSSSSSSCPFSMPFVRYRIDLSSASSVNGSGKKDKSKSKSSSGGLSGLGGLFSSVRLSMDRSAVERRYKDDVDGGNLRWIDCSSSLSSMELKRGNNGDETGGAGRDTGDAGDSAVEGLEGVRAAAAFWTAVADLSSPPLHGDDDHGDGDGSGGGRMVLSLPNASLLSVHRLADVATWLSDRMVDGSVPALQAAGTGAVPVHVEVDAEAAVPTVVLTAAREESRTATAATTARSTDGATATTDNDDRGQQQQQQLSTDDETVKSSIQSWVRRILVQLEICPFTKSDMRSGQGLADLGVPTGRIAYHHSPAATSQSSRLLADTWAAMVDMMEAGEGGKNGVSSILLAAPKFDDDFELWAGPVFAMLEATVSAVSAEPSIGVVCFHPRYATPDGTTWPGFGHMHSVPRLRKWVEEEEEKEGGDGKGKLEPGKRPRLTEEEVAAGGAWQRRTPHAVINVLRADQLERAEGRRVTGNLYARNIRVLVGREDGIGSRRLEEDLRKEQRLGM